MKYVMKIGQVVSGRAGWNVLYDALDKLAIGDDLTVQLDGTNHNAARTAVHRYARKHEHKSHNWTFATQSEGRLLTISKIEKWYL